MAKILGFWVVLFGVAFVNGALRAVVYGPIVGEPWAHHLSVVTGVLLIGFTLWLLHSKWPFTSRQQAATSGLFWMILTEFFEVSMVVGFMKKSWTDFLQMHQLLQGESWLIFLLWIGIAPSLLYWWQHQRSGKPLAPDDTQVPFAHETLTKKARRLLVGVYLLLLFHALCLFVSAGTWQWKAAWLFLSLEIAFYSAEIFLIALTNPAVLNARAQKHEGTEPFEHVILWTHLILMVLLFVSAGLDAGRFQWSVMPASLSTVGLFLLLSGACLSTWALVVNPFFEPTVRIQTDRQHQVIQQGPYQYIRHPGYAGAISLIIGNTLVLGSWIAFGFAVLCAINLIRRTYLEDNVLSLKLAGYSIYTQQVRYRLFPFLW